MGRKKKCRNTKKSEKSNQQNSEPGKKTLLKSDTEFQVILIDAAENPIERPKKRVQNKKRIKHRNNNRRKHDFKLFKESKVRWTKKVCGLTDSGYTGIKKIQSNVTLPHKMKKTHL